MKSLIIYASIHHGNTKKIAKEIGGVLDAKIVSFHEVQNEDIKEADLIGFGSGVYFSKFHKGISNLALKLPEMKSNKAFLFSTSGMKRNIIFNRSHSHFKRTLKEKNFKIVGEFSCLGYDTYNLLKYIGGINRGRPNEKDFENARMFAKSLIK